MHDSSCFCLCSIGVLLIQQQQQNEVSVLHRFVVVPEGMSPGSLLAKLLRSTKENTGPDAPYPRVLVFAADAETADKMATALRAAVWEEYRVGLVLPGGDFPTKMLQVLAHICN